MGAAAAQQHPAASRSDARSSKQQPLHWCCHHCLCWHRGWQAAAAVAAVAVAPARCCAPTTPPRSCAGPRLDASLSALHVAPPCAALPTIQRQVLQLIPAHTGAAPLQRRATAPLVHAVAAPAAYGQSPTQAAARRLAAEILVSLTQPAALL